MKERRGDEDGRRRREIGAVLLRPSRSAKKRWEGGGRLRGSPQPSRSARAAQQTHAPTSCARPQHPLAPRSSAHQAACRCETHLVFPAFLRSIGHPIPSITSRPGESIFALHLPAQTSLFRAPPARAAAFPPPCQAFRTRPPYIPRMHSAHHLLRFPCTARLMLHSPRAPTVAEPQRAPLSPPERPRTPQRAAE